MRDLRIGFAMCGSFCTHSKGLDSLEAVANQYSTVVPILSDIAMATDTRFGRAQDLIAEMEEICQGKPVISTIKDAEPIGPQKLLDVLVIAPCTGNTLAKLAAGIADTAVTMAAKSHLRNGRPVVLAISTNDGLSTAARNIGELQCRKNYYFVPYRQDDPHGKPTSLVAEMNLVVPTIEASLHGEQLQPLLLGP